MLVELRVDVSHLVDVIHETGVNFSYEITKLWNAVRALITGRQPAGNVE